MRSKIAAALEAAGVVCGAVAGFAVSATAGFGVLAVGLILFGLALERG